MHVDDARTAPAAMRAFKVSSRAHDILHKVVHV